MKRLCSMLTSLCLLSGAAIAQQTPGPVQPKLTKMMQNASAKNLEEAKHNLLFFYRAGLADGVDRLLTQYPQLVNTKIKGRYGKEIPLVYDCFLNLIARCYKNTKKSYKDDECERLKDRTFFMLSAKAKQRPPVVNDMLRVFYKHGAECRQCLQIFRNADIRSTLDYLYEETYVQYAPMYGVTLAEMPLYARENRLWLPIAKEIRVTTKEEVQSTIRAMATFGEMSDILGRLVSKNPDVQQTIEKYRSAFEEIYKQEKLDSLPAVPKAKLVTFLGENYQPTTAEEADKAIKDVNAAYQHKVETEYLAYGEKSPASLKTQRDQAVKELQTARTQLTKYEETAAEKRKTQDIRKETVATTIKMFKADMELVRLFLKHFKGGIRGEWTYVPNGAEAGEITYQIPVLIQDRISNPAEGFDPSHSYPYIPQFHWKVVYDARPERFGNELQTLTWRREVTVYGGSITDAGPWRKD